MVLGFAPL